MVLGANFSEWWTFNFSRNFPDFKIHDPQLPKNLKWATMFTRVILPYIRNKYSRYRVSVHEWSPHVQTLSTVAIAVHK